MNGDCRFQPALWDWTCCCTMFPSICGPLLDIIAFGPWMAATSKAQSMACRIYSWTRGRMQPATGCCPSCWPAASQVTERKRVTAPKCVVCWMLGWTPLYVCRNTVNWSALLPMWPRRRRWESLNQPSFRMPWSSFIALFRTMMSPLMTNCFVPFALWWRSFYRAAVCTCTAGGDMVEQELWFVLFWWHAMVSAQQRLKTSTTKRSDSAGPEMGYGLDLLCRIFADIGKLSHVGDHVGGCRYIPVVRVSACVRIQRKSRSCKKFYGNVGFEYFFDLQGVMV